MSKSKPRRHPKRNVQSAQLVRTNATPEHRPDLLPVYEEVLAQLRQLNTEALGGRLPIDEIVAELPKLVLQPKAQAALLERSLPLAQGHEEEVATLLLLLWNLTPQSDMGGKTALEIFGNNLAVHGTSEAAPHSEPASGSEVGEADLDDDDPEWVSVVPLLEGIKVLFQGVFFLACEDLPRRKREVVLNGLHILFFRYWHTVCEELEEWPPMLALEHQREHGLDIPEDQHIVMRMYRNPEQPDNPDENVMTMCGAESETLMPLYWDYVQSARGAKPEVFWADPEYQRWLKELSDHQVGGGPGQASDQAVLQYVFETSLARWLKVDTYVKGKITFVAWYEFWREILQQPVYHADDSEFEWWTLDDIYDQLDARTGLTGYRLIAAFDAASSGGDAAQLGRIRVELGEKAFDRQMRDVYFFSCNLFEYLVVPLGLYMPVIQPLWQEPMDVEEEIGEIRESNEPLVRTVAKPPAMLRPTQYGAELLALLAPKPVFIKDDMS